MDQVSGVIAGWWAYLTRWPVLLQIFVVLGPPIGVFIAKKYLPLKPLPRHYYFFLSTGCIISAISIMVLIGARAGLAIFLSVVYFTWLLIDWLRNWLEPNLDSDLLSRIDTGILRPLLLIASTFVLADKVSNINQLAAIPLWAWFGSTLTVGQVTTVLIAIYIFIVGSLPISILLSSLFGRLLNLTAGSKRALSLIFRYSIVATGIVWALDFTGFNRTAILAVAGGLSVGLGFGIKEVFANFISGIWLLLEGAVRPGEVLLIDNDACEVRKLGLRAALLWRDRDNTELLIPNQVFLTTTTTTFTGTDGMRRCQVQISAAYSHQPLEVMSLIVQATTSVHQVLSQPSPVALILDYGDSAVQYAVRFWIANPMNGSTACSDVRLAIWNIFQANHIEIPYPQLVLYQRQ